MSHIFSFLLPMDAKYDRIGGGYNQTRKADPWLFSQMKALLDPSPEGKYLDIGCGTGNYTLEFAREGYPFIGVEPSEKMLSVARARSARLTWVKGHAEDIPLESQSIEAALASLTLHHWSDLGRGMQEVARVLKAGGSFVVFTSTPEQMKGYWLNHYFPRMLARSIEQMPSLEAVLEALEQAGLRLVEEIPYFVKNDLEDHFLYVGKHRPHLYLDPEIRSGISSFSDLALGEEVAKGLDKLKRDIASGQIETLIRLYENEGGDYLFLKGIK